MSKEPSTASFTKGSRLLHPVHGSGRVVTVAAGGRRLLVRFDRRPAVPTMVRADSVQLDVSEPVAPVAAPPSSEAPALQIEQDDARQALEALRLGVVPRHGLAAITVGRGAELARIGRVLSGEPAGMLVLEGSYGAGKSHMLELTAELARDRGYGVATASFDPVEVPPSHPLRLYRALMESLHWPDGARGLAPLFERLDAGQAPEHRWLSAAHFAWSLDAGVHPTLPGDVMDFVTGRRRAYPGPLAKRLRRAGYTGPRPLGLPDYRTFGQVMAHLLSGVGAWARAAGHRGLVVVLDEAEYLDRLEPTGRAFARAVLSHLAVAALPDDALAFDPAELRAGGHAAHRALSPRAVGDPSLVVVAAVTPAPSVSAVLEGIFARPSQRLSLRSLRPSVLPALAERVGRLAMMAYPELAAARRRPGLSERLTAVLADAFASGAIQSPRQAARFVVEFYDHLRWEPARALSRLPRVGR